MANDFSEIQQKREASMELTRREMERESRDTIRIYNPLDHTFVYKFDGYNHQVPSKGTKDEPRFLANHYFKKIAEYIIGKQSIEKGEELLNLRTKQLGKQFLDKYEENREVWDKVPRLDDPDLQREIKKVVILGVVEEYGMEVLENEPTEFHRAPSLLSLSDQIFNEEIPKVSDITAEKSTIKSPDKVKLEKEIENDN